MPEVYKNYTILNYFSTMPLTYQSDKGSGDSPFSPAKWREKCRSRKTLVGTSEPMNDRWVNSEVNRMLLVNDESIKHINEISNITNEWIN